MNSTAQVEKISNGYIVTTYPSSGAIPGVGQTKTYCADLASVNALLTTSFSPTTP